MDIKSDALSDSDPETPKIYKQYNQPKNFKVQERLKGVINEKLISKLKKDGRKTENVPIKNSFHR